ncbi:hypothetical protein [Micromonospora aurantiaca (nom. illeg.)]|uniref:hypothetical protein n=1 Tax=Micromonospora aurantiaca (nom. illeg.) TaxID=47850 RepID=UPI0037B1DD81
MVARKIVFYRWESVNAQREFVPWRVVALLAAEIAQDPKFAVLDDEDNGTAVIPLGAGNENLPVKLQLLALRPARNRPAQWSPGTSPVNIPMPEGHYVSDVTHIMMWPDGYLAHDYHVNLPRPSRLVDFLYRKLRVQAAFRQLYRPDMYERLAALEGQIRSFNFTFTKPHRELVDPPMVGTLWRMIKGAPVPSISVRMGFGKHGPRDRYIDHGLEQELLQLASAEEEFLDRLVVTGKSRITGSSDTVNLMTERIHEQVELSPQVDNSAFPDVEETFTTLDLTYKKFLASGLLDNALEARRSHR